MRPSTGGTPQQTFQDFLQGLLSHNVLAAIALLEGDPRVVEAVERLDSWGCSFRGRALLSNKARQSLRGTDFATTFWSRRSLAMPRGSVQEARSVEFVFSMDDLDLQVINT
jgi:hypothetical protein